MHKKAIMFSIIPTLLFNNFIVPFAAEIGLSQSQSSLLQYEQPSSYTITIPKNIVLQSNELQSLNKTSVYIINVKGDILGTETITVIPDDSVIMHDKNGKKDVSATVEQDKTEFPEAEITEAGESGINESGSISAN